MKIYLLLTLVFLTACTGAQTSSGQDIKIEFTEIPTSDLYNNDIFNVGIQITNNGNSPVQGQVCTRDSVSNYYEGIPDGICEGVSLQAAERFQDAREPEVHQTNFGPFKYTKLDPNHKLTSTITAVFRYDVQTSAATEMCVKHPAADTTDIPCQKEENIQPTQQSQTPLQVTNIKKTTRRVGQDEINVVLDITVEVTEDGTVISDINNPLGQDIPEVEYEVIYDNQNIVCSNAPTGTIEWRKDRNKKMLHCQQQMALNQEFLNAPLEVKLAYAFEKRISSGSIDLVTT